MTRPKLPAAIFVLVLFMLVSEANGISASKGVASIPNASSTLPVPFAPHDTFFIYMPLVTRNSTLSSGRAIVINHTTIDLGRIPTNYLEQAKAQLRASYGHTSHGSQPITGMTFLRGLDPQYDFNTDGAIQAGVLSIADYTPTGDLGNPDRTTWASRTRTYLSGVSGNRNVVLWA